MERSLDAGSLLPTGKELVPITVWEKKKSKFHSITISEGKKDSSYKTFPLFGASCCYFRLVRLVLFVVSLESAAMETSPAALQTLVAGTVWKWTRNGDVVYVKLIWKISKLMSNLGQELVVLWLLQRTEGLMLALSLDDLGVGRLVGAGGVNVWASIQAHQEA